MKKLVHTCGALLLIAVCTNAVALAGFSRACMYTQIPSALVVPALVLLNLLGMPGRYLQLPTFSAEEKRRHVVLEAVTTDYGQLRYFLYAEMQSFVWLDRVPPWRTPGGRFQFHAAYTSGPWHSEKLPPDITRDSRLAVFRFNRKVLFSVRAGHPDFMERYSGPMHDYTSFRVFARHWYYDPLAQYVGYVGSSWAIDCNLSEWGFEDR